jgi:hypothetical protein
VTSLYEELQTPSITYHQEIAADLINGIRSGDEDARIHYWSLVTDVLATELESMPDTSSVWGNRDPRWNIGEFSPSGSASLITWDERSRNFLDTIANAQPIDESGNPIEIISAIDAGCGSSAFLAVGTAMLHPNAEIQAYELNPTSAECARRVVKYLGLADRIKVRQGNALTIDFDEAIVGLSETFGAGFLREPGLEMIYRLAQKTRLVMPAIGKLFARDFSITKFEPDYEPWQNPTEFDLTKKHEYISVNLTTSEDGPRSINVFSGLYRADGTPIITDPSIDDDITQPLTIAATPDAPKGSRFAIRYRPGLLLDHRNLVEIRQIG